MGSEDLRIPEWPREARRPTVAVEPGMPGQAAIEVLVRLAREGRWRVSVADDGGSVRIADHVALVVNLSQAVSRPRDLWRPSVLTAEATDDGVGGSRVEVTLDDHGSIGLRPRVTGLLSAWVAAMEGRGVRVRTGLWRDEALDAQLAADGASADQPDTWSAEGTRLEQIAEREQADRGAPGAFALTDGARAWADALAETCGTAEEPLTETTARAWMDGLLRAGVSRMRQPRPAYVVDALVGAAVRGGVLRLPEPGVLRMSYARRDPEGEGETAWGWGFKPGSTAALTWHAERPCGVDEVTSEALGGAAVVEVLSAVVESLDEMGAGPVDELRCW